MQKRQDKHFQERSSESNRQSLKNLDYNQKKSQKQIPNKLVHHNNDPQNRFNKYFIEKYESSLPIIQQHQQNRDRLDTPFINAQKSLKSIVEEEMQQQLNQTNATTNSFKQKNLNKFGNKTASMKRTLLRDDRTERNTNAFGAQFSFDKSLLTMLEDSLAIMIEYSQNMGQSMPPNFQQYWEICFEIKLEQITDIFEKWRDHINFALQLDYSVVSIAQCVWGELHEKGGISSETEHAVYGIIENMLFLLQQNLLIIIDLLMENKLVKQVTQSVWQGDLEKTIEQKKIRNLQENYLFEMKRNNEFLDHNLKDLIQLQQMQAMQIQNRDKIQIKPIFLVVLHCLKNKKELSIEKIRENIVNGTFLTMRKPIEKEESPLKNIYVMFEDSNLMMQQNAAIAYSMGEDQEAPEAPFLKPKAEKEFQYSLVLDLDETLGHYDMETQKFYRRPFLDEFLEGVKNHYELIIFTAGIQDYADQVLDEIDKNRYIKHRLYRQHTFFENNNFIKDLSLIGRDLQKTIIVDNNHTNFKYQPENAIFIKTWINEENDKELIYLKNLLIKLAQSEVDDMRKGLQQYRDYTVRQITIGNKEPQLHL